MDALDEIKKSSKRIKKRGAYLMKKILILFILSLNAGTCISEENTAEPVARSRAPHAIPSEKLRFIMLKLNSSLQGSKHADIKKNPIDEDQTAELIKAVGDLLLSAELMANEATEAPDARLEKFKQIAFRSMAIKLYVETVNLKKVLDVNEYELIEPAYRRINETCIACHDTFPY